MYFPQIGQSSVSGSFFKSHMWDWCVPLSCNLIILNTTLTISSFGDRFWEKRKGKKKRTERQRQRETERLEPAVERGGVGWSKISSLIAIIKGKRKREFTVNPGEQFNLVSKHR